MLRAAAPLGTATVSIWPSGVGTYEPEHLGETPKLRLEASFAEHPCGGAGANCEQVPGLTGLRSAFRGFFNALLDCL